MVDSGHTLQVRVKANMDTVKTFFGTLAKNNDEESYQLYLKLWNVVCKAYRNLPLYLTCRPPVDVVNCRHLTGVVRGEMCRREVTVGMEMSIGPSIQSVMCLSNLVWSGTSRYTDYKATWGWKCDNLGSQKLWNDAVKSAEDDAWKEGMNEKVQLSAGSRVMNTEIVQDERDKNHIHAKSTISAMSPLFLAMFLSKGFAFLSEKTMTDRKFVSINQNGENKEEEEVSFNKKKIALCPISFCQPSCNHRDYDFSALKDKVLDMMSQNLQNTQNDPFGSNTLYCMAYKEVACGVTPGKVKSNPLYITPFHGGLASSERIETSTCPVATAVSMTDVKNLADVFGIEYDTNVIVPDNIKIGKGYNSSKLQYVMFSDTDAKDRFFCQRLEVCHTLSYVMVHLNIMFDGFKTLISLMRFRKFLRDKLQLDGLDAPNNVPDLLEECRTLFHAVTPIRMGMIEGMGRMISVHYLSRFQYPEENDAVLLQRFFKGMNIPHTHTLDGMKKGWFTGFMNYLQVVCKDSAKVMLHNPACVEKDSVYGIVDEHGFWDEDMLHMKHLSQSIQNAAAKVQATGVADLLKNYLGHLNFSLDGEMKLYIMKPGDLPSCYRSQKLNSEKNLRMDYLNHFIRLGQLCEYVTTDPPSGLKTWFSTFAQAYSKFSFRHHFTDAELELFGYTQKERDDGATAYALHRVFAFVCGKRVGSPESGPFFDKIKVLRKHMPVFGYTLAFLVGLCLDYWYDSATMKTLITMVNNNCRASSKGEEFLEKHCPSMLRQCCDTVGIENPQICVPKKETFATNQNQAGQGLKTIPLFFTSEGEAPFGETNLSLTQWVFLNHLQRPVFMLYYTAYQNYVRDYVLRRTGVNAERAGASGYPKLLPQTTYKVFTNCATQVRALGIGIVEIVTVGNDFPFFPTTLMLCFRCFSKRSPRPLRHSVCCYRTYRLAVLFCKSLNQRHQRRGSEIAKKKRTRIRMTTRKSSPLLPEKLRPS